MSAKILGIGNPSFDHIFLYSGNDIVYRYSRGGGTTANVLANLSNMGFETSLLGICGINDIYGEAALSDLENLGVNTDSVEKDDNKKIQHVFQLNKKRNVSEHEFFHNCIVCGKKTGSTRRRISQITIEKSNSINLQEINFAVFDKLNIGNVKLNNYLKHQNRTIKTIIDVGYISGLRFKNVEEIIDLFSVFDIYFINEKVFIYINRLFKQNGGFVKLINNKDNNGKLFVITLGKKGVDYFLNNEGIVENGHVEAMFNNPICTSGAGDAFLAYFVLHYTNFIEGKSETSFNNQIVKEILIRCNEGINNKLQYLGARGHLPRDKYTLPVNIFKNKSLNDIKRETMQNEYCPFCFSKNPKTRIPINSNYPISNIDNILYKIPEKIFDTMLLSKEIDKCKELIDKYDSFFIVGSGGSKSPSLFISDFIQTEFGKAAIFMYPLDFVAGMGPKLDCLILLSYSGNNNDCELVMKKAIEIGVKCIVLITGNKQTNLRLLLRKKNSDDDDIIIDYEDYCKNHESGFLSFSGVILPCVLFLSIIKEKFNKNVLSQIFTDIQSLKMDDFGKISNAIKNNGVLELIGGPFTRPAIFDLESKFIEGGICAVQIHEAKDFSHGRFMYSLNNVGRSTPKLMLQVDENYYEQALFNKIRENVGDTPIIRMRSINNGIIGGFEMLIKCQYLIYYISKIITAGKEDITKPRNIPREGLALFRWQP